MAEVVIHAFKARTGHPGCARCGFTRTTEWQHGHSCIGRIILDRDEKGAHCYECGKHFEIGSPVAVRRA